MMGSFDNDENVARICTTFKVKTARITIPSQQAAKTRYNAGFRKNQPILNFPARFVALLAQ
jgi:hypothetical protein